jgi:hypothetical protein
MYAGYYPHLCGLPLMRMLATSSSLLHEKTDLVLLQFIAAPLVPCYSKDALGTPAIIAHRFVVRQFACKCILFDFTSLPQLHAQGGLGSGFRV